MSQLTILLTQLRQSLPIRLILPIFAGALLLGPIIGAGTFLATHSFSFPALAERVSAHPPEQGGIASQGPGKRAQPGCQGESCFNQDPIKEGCAADASTPESLPIIYDGSFGVLHPASALTIQPGEQIGRLDLRYSPTCQAYWARVFSFASTGAAAMTLSYGPDQQLLDPTLPPGPALSIYSDMTPVPQPATATITLIDASTRQFPITVTLG